MLCVWKYTGDSVSNFDVLSTRPFQKSSRHGTCSSKELLKYAVSCISHFHTSIFARLLPFYLTIFTICPGLFLKWMLYSDNIQLSVNKDTLEIWGLIIICLQYNRRKTKNGKVLRNTPRVPRSHIAWILCGSGDLVNGGRFCRGTNPKMLVAVDKI